MIVSRRRAVWILLSVVGLILLSLGGIYLDTWLKAGAAIEREKLRLQERITQLRAERAERPVFFEGPEAGNSWEFLVRAIESLDAIPSGDLEAFPSFRKDETKDVHPEAAEKILATLQPGLADLKRALRRSSTEPGYEYERAFPLKMPSLSHAMQLAKLLGDAARFRHDAGRTEETVDFLILALGIADRIAVKGFLINYMVAHACASVVLERLQSILADHRFTSAQLKRLQDAFDAAAAARIDAMTALRNENMMARGTVMEFADGSKSLPKRPRARDFFSMRICAARFLAGQDELLGAMERCRTLPFRDRQRALERLQREVWSSENLLQKLVASSDIVRPWRQDANLTLSYSLARISLAVARHREDRGAFPSALKDLAPAYLPSVPDDQINGKPFSYSAKADAATLYSWGGDGDDDGGKPVLNPAFDLDDDGDIVWMIQRRKSDGN